ncbi:hypothetical protein BH10BDE1_BH10BDE1_09220 [soil metagenome]
MDLNGLLRLIFLEKSDLTVGVLIGLTLIVVVLMLVRSVMEEKQAPAATSGAVDQKSLNAAVEGAIKKALADMPVAKAEAAASDDDAAAAAALSTTLSEREAKIATLMTEIEVLKTQAEANVAAGAGGVDSSEDLAAQLEKVKELQAKLSEYEIIEDDIADLSIFKEENKKLKDEIEQLRAATQTAQVQVQTAQASVVDPTPSADAVHAAQSAIMEAPVARTPVESFKLDTSDDVMGEFAQALSGGAKPAAESAASSMSAGESGDDEEVVDPFGPLDTEKMIAEVASLDEGNVEGSTSILEDELDTDRLMAEMGMSEPVTPSAEPEFEAAPEAQVAPSVAAIAKEKPVIVESDDSSAAAALKDVPVDDLLAEFQDNDYPTLKGTKGS